MPRESTILEEMTPVDMTPTTDMAANNTVSTVTNPADNVIRDAETERLSVDASRR